MATTVITGKDLTLTINSVNHDAQASSVVMKLENDQAEIETLDGMVYKTLKTTGSLSVTLWQDWGATPSLCETLWNAAKSAPDTAIAFSFTANTGSVFTGSVFPNFPETGGNANEALTTTVELKISNGSVTLT